MESFVIPSPPNWYESDVMACAPDNTIMYGSRNDLIIIKPTENDQPNDIQVIPDAHFKSITIVNFNKNWGSPYKYAVTASTDKVIKLWDIETLRRKMSHNKHCSEDVVKVIGVSFAGDNRVVSATSEGQVIIWNLVNNEHTILDSIFKTFKGTLTSFSICPHEASRAAFGLRNGLVIIADLRGSGKVLATYRGHKSEVTSMSWCPVPVNIFPKNPNNTVGERKLEDAANKAETVESYTSLDGASATTNSTVESSPDVASENKNCPSIQCSPNGTKETSQINNTEHNEAEVVNSKQPESTEKSDNEDCSSNGISLLSAQQDQDTGSTLAVTSNIEVSTLPDNLDDESDGATTNTQVKLDNGDSVDNEPRTPIEKTSSPELSKSVAKVIDSETESNTDTPTDRRIISMELSNSTQSEPVKLLNVEGDADTPTDRRNVSMELSHSIENTPDVVKPEAELKTEEGENKTEVDASESTGQQERSRKKISNKQNIAEEESPLTENWRTESSLPKIEEQPRREFLLATSARDGYVYIWQTLGGPLATFFTIPFSKTKARNTKATPKDVFNVLCWATPHMLLSSMNNGELLGWILPKPAGLNKAYRKIHHQHGKQITCIKVPTVYWDETNFLQKRNLTVWTTGLDRVLCNFDCGSDQLKTYYQSLNGSACYLDGCPFDPSRLAMGDEKNIKIWNLGQTSNKIFQFPTSFDKIHSVITAMAWHPTDENSVAWGTQEGRIGILTISGKKLKTRVLPQYFKSEIFKLEWGPGRVSSVRNLFAISEGVVVSFDTELDEEPVPLVLPPPGETKVTLSMLYTFAWSPDYSFFFASSKTGGCIQYDKHLESYEVFYMQPRIESVVWHPDAYVCQNGGFVTEYSKMFASVVMGTGVKLFSYSKNNEKIWFTPLTFISNKNKTRIRAIQWSPFLANNLVWVDEAGLAVVVNIVSGQILHTYINPWLDGLVSVYWSPIDKDYIILATDNRMVLSIKITDYPDLSQEEIDAAINRISKKRGAELAHNLPKPKEDKKEKEGGKAKVKKSLLVPVFYTIKEKNQVSDLRKVLQWKLEGSVSSDEDFSSSQIGVLDVFGDDRNLEKIFELNVSSFTQNNHTDKLNMMALIKGNVNETIKNAIEQKRVTMWIINVASMVSPQCWKDACKTYVEQLLDQPNPDVFEVVTFQLICHQVEEAVKFLCDRKLFREAYVLAKTRLGSGHAAINIILTQWAKHCSYEGNYELATCCYITLGMFSEAAYLLFRRTNIELLDLAVQLAKLAGNDDLQKAIEDKVEALRKPVDLAGSLLPYLDRNGEKLRIFTTKTPSNSDLSEAQDSDNEVTAEPKQEPVNTVEATEQPQKEETQTAQPIEKNTEQPATLAAEEHDKLDGSDYDESFASAVDIHDDGDEFQDLENDADVTLEFENLEDSVEKASQLSDVAEETEDLQEASKPGDGDNPTKTKL